MNFSNVPRTSSMVEEDGSFAEYRMSRNCTREPDANRSYSTKAFNNESHVLGERRGAYINHKVGVPVYILIFAINLRHQSQRCRQKRTGGKDGTNRIGKRWVEVLKGLAITQCFLVFACAYCETQSVSPGEDQGHKRLYLGTGGERRLSSRSSLPWVERLQALNATHVSELLRLRGRHPVSFSFPRRQQESEYRQPPFAHRLSTAPQRL